MKYRRIPSKKHHEPREHGALRRMDAERRLKLYSRRVDAIDLDNLFEQKRLGKGKKESIFSRMRKHLGHASEIRKRVFAAISRTAKRVYIRTSAFFSRVLSKARIWAQKRRAERREPTDIPMLSGALVGAFTVALISAVVVLYTLFLSDFFGPYEKVTVPNMLGMSYDEARASLDEKLCDVEVIYEYSSVIPEGKVISQTPDGGAERKVFFRGKPCSVSMVVSRGKELLEIPNYVGISVRDASLELKNSAFSVAVVEEDNDDVASGKVISTSPAGGEMLEVGGLVVLHVSRGREKTMLLVPELLGLTEASAVAKIRAAGFTLGEVKYNTSKTAAGIVIAQDRIALTKSARGGKISITVSAGQTYLTKNVPSLYGLTVDEARKRLADYGLVAGNIYAAESNEPSGTIIAQSPAAGSEISPDVVSIDMYVSE